MVRSPKEKWLEQCRRGHTR